MFGCLNMDMASPAQSRGHSESRQIEKVSPQTYLHWNGHKRVVVFVCPWPGQAGREVGKRARSGPNALQLVELRPNKRRTEKLILCIVYAAIKVNCTATELRVIGPFVRCGYMGALSPESAPGYLHPHYPRANLIWYCSKYRNNTVSSSRSDKLAIHWILSVTFKCFKARGTAATFQLFKPNKLFMHVWHFTISLKSRIYLKIYCPSAATFLRGPGIRSSRPSGVRFTTWHMGEDNRRE